jgi:hypothetical protein
MREDCTGKLIGFKVVFPPSALPTAVPTWFPVGMLLLHNLPFGKRRSFFQQTALCIQNAEL